jgi:hypothetical protein
MAVVRVVRPGFSGSADARSATWDATQRVVVTATSAIDERPRTRFAVLAALFVVAVFGGAFLARGLLQAPLRLAADMGAFALIYVVTQGIERALEPFTFWIHPVDKAKAAAKAAKEQIAVAPSADEAQQAARRSADNEALVNRTTAERAILFWLAASVIGIVVSGWLGLQFISMVLDQSSRGEVPRWFDVALTGFMVGGGTKLVHGLIERVGKPKEPAEDK